VRALQELNEEPIAQLILNAMYGVDTFFLMRLVLNIKKLENHFF
jgi:hypothetical protein